MIIACAVKCAVWAIESRLINGASVWAEPLQYELALAIHAGTLGLVVSRLGQPLSTNA
jgi:hypothetical protein